MEGRWLSQALVEMLRLVAIVGSMSVGVIVVIGVSMVVIAGVVIGVGGRSSLSSSSSICQRRRTE